MESKIKEMKRKIFVWTIVTLITLLCIVQTTSAGTISGYILEPYHNDSIEYACVCGNDTCDETNSAGYYELTGVTGGPHTIIACIAIYYCNTTTASEGDTNVNITLTIEREKTNESVPILDEHAYEMLMESWGSRFHWTNETNCGEMTSQNMSYNFTLFGMAISEPYVNIMGSLFFLFLFSMPFLMMYLRQENVLIPSISGMILGGMILGFLPAEYHLPAIAFIALSITGVLYIALKERT